jgi:acetyl/propionyl-CoA carboxylase alpha subunit
MLQKVVIANRGVVAMRIARTLRRLGVPYAVVYSEADAGLPYVREATEAAPIGEARPQSSYLRHDAILEGLGGRGATPSTRATASCQKTRISPAPCRRPA